MRTHSNESLAERLSAVLAGIPILPRRMLLDTSGVAATVPMLRGVWGAALHDLDPAAYAAVFGPNDEPPGRGAAGNPSGRSQPPHRPGPALAAPSRPQPASFPAGGTRAACYLLRPAPPDPEFAPAVDWILIGDALQHDFNLCRAWDVASGMGLGPQRRRFHLRRILILRPDGRTAEHAAVWPLSEVRWQADGPVGPPDGGSGPSRDLAPDQPCRLVFSAPLRLLFRKQLIEAPTLADLTVAACRRVKAYLPAARQPAWEELSRAALETARGTPAGLWQGERLDLQRYSARQQADLELRGVSGFLDLPRGPGPLWPLLAAAAWLHLGKGTVMGLGQFAVGKLHGPDPDSGTRSLGQRPNSS